MFKRFLKFLKGEEDGASIQFEGSYLEHLFEQVRPFVHEELKECPDHDPHLLLVIGLLRATMLDRWADEFRRPLVDWTTIGVDPPPPPAEDPASGTAEVDVLADTEATEGDGGEAIDGAADTEDFTAEARIAEKAVAAEAEKDSDGDEESDSGAKSEDADETSEEDFAETIEDSGDDDFEIVAEEKEPESEEPQHWSRITEEISLSDIEQHSVHETRDNTLEIDKSSLMEGDAPRVDSPQVLQAGRVFLTLLLENDRLPSDLQLNVSETVLARDLLLGYFGGDDDFESKAKRLLALVEKKFGDGLFSQARILLQLFQTDEQTRVNNDRNLFYEDMILRLGIRRRHPLSEEELQIFRDRLKNADTDEGTRDLARWLDEVCLIKFHLLLRDPAQAENWKTALEPCGLVKAKEAFHERVPPKRWRTVDAFANEPVSEQIRRHVSSDTAKKFVLNQLKTCYFILRAVGDTGLEGFLDTFFDWTSDQFDLNGTLLMPLLYNRSMQETAAMNSILEDIYEEHFAAKVEEKVAGITDEEIDAAARTVLKNLSKSDLGEIAPGYYDLGGFVFDTLFEVEYPTAEFAAKIHRIT